jgi:predicted aldo/keto reductase-like oxidoreductase
MASWAVALNKGNFTTELIQRSGKFTASILSEAADFELFKYFDIAYIYEGSEEATKAALCDRYPRESYYLADKLNGSDFAAKSEEDILQQANPNASFASWAVRFAASLPNVMTLHHLYVFISVPLKWDTNDMLIYNKV